MIIVGQVTNTITLLNIEYTAKNLKNLYKMYTSLENMEENGNDNGTVIKLDLDYCLKKIQKEEQDLIVKILIEGLDYRTYAEERNISISAISKKLIKILDKCAWHLNNARNNNIDPAEKFLQLRDKNYYNYKDRDYLSYRQQQRIQKREIRTDKM